MSKNSPLTYRGSTALVTGASKGLGKDFAEVLASRGMNVVLVARTKDGLTEYAKSLINLASNSSFQPLPYMAGYAATKAFVLYFSEAIQHELAEKGVHVMASCPGPTATSFFEGTSTNVASRDFDSSLSVVE